MKMEKAARDESPFILYYVLFISACIVLKRLTFICE